jgi:predicted phage terminase large subunit-like protein
MSAEQTPVAAPQNLKTIGPQAGPQTDFLSTSADIALYGGAAGSGKSFGLLLEPLRHYNNPLFGGVIFRRNSTQVRNEGGLWNESEALYTQLGGYPRQSSLEWEFPSGMRMKFAHLEFDRSVYDWQGSQIPYIGFDELVHFSEKQFFYMLSRNRSLSGVSGYIRATCNPDSDSWVRKFIDWWIGEDGFPIRERSGVIRWFIRQDDQIIWASTREELIEKYGTKQLPKSFTFIAAKVHDNKILMEKDPSYLSNLMALSRVERMRLLEGNWNVRPAAGMFFQRGWFEIVDAIPSGWMRVVRYWDRAATKPNETNSDPDWTRGLKLYQYPNNIFLVSNVRGIQDTPLKVESFVKNTAIEDGPEVTICVEQDPGSSGVADAGNYTRLLSGYDVRVRKPAVAKDIRARAVSAQSEAGNVKILRGAWNDSFFNELENFPDGAHDDQVDVFSGAFNEFMGVVGILDAL